MLLGFMPLGLIYPALRSAADKPPLLLQRMRWEAVLRGVFAGNIFDLGCAATTAAYHEVRCCWASCWACWPAAPAHLRPAPLATNES